MLIGLPNGGESCSVSGRGLSDPMAQSCPARSAPGWLSFQFGLALVLLRLLEPVLPRGGEV